MNDSDVFWTSVKLLDVVCEAIGLPLDGKKAEDDMEVMIALGVEVTVNIEEWCISTRLEEEKVGRWQDELIEIEDQGIP